MNCSFGKTVVVSLVSGLVMLVSGCPNGGNGSSDGQASTTNVTGRWIQTDPCDPLMIFDLVQSGSDVTGTARESTGAQLGPLTGTLDGNRLTLDLTILAGYSTHFDMTVDGDRMSGSWTSTMGMSGLLNMLKQP